MLKQGQPKVQSRLLRVFLLQLALISILTIAGVMMASLVAERVLVNQALVGEADYFWLNRSREADFPLPDTLNLQSHISSDPDNPVPESLVQLDSGQHRVNIEGDDRIVHVSELGGERLYLLFQDETVSRLAFYFGIVPLTLILLIMYGLAYLAYVLSKRAVSPISRLANTIENFKFNERDATDLDLSKLRRSTNSETAVLADALSHFVERGKASVERERNFTRYASHELRTPLAVIQGSVSSLELLGLEGAPGRAIARIKRTTRQMSDLISTLLVLAREKSEPERGVLANANEVVEQLMAEARQWDVEKPVQLTLTQNASLSVAAPEALISVVIGNVLRNAFLYTDEGLVQVSVNVDSVTISDSGPGLDEVARERIFEPFYRVDAENTMRPGQGLGLAIVKQACNYYGWDIQVESTIGMGSTFSIRF